MKIDLDVRGDREVQLLIDKMEYRVRNPREYFEDHAGPILMASHRKAFDTGGSSQGFPWRRHSERTVQRMGQHRVLENTRRLRRSLTVKGSKDQKFDIRGDALYYGTKVYYAKFLYENRPFLRLNTFDIDKLRKALVDYIVPKT